MNRIAPLLFGFVLCMPLGCSCSGKSSAPPGDSPEWKPTPSEQPATALAEPEPDAMVAAAPQVEPSAAPRERPGEIRLPDVVYVPTPQRAVDKMLDLAEVKPTDVVYDLGCGDGRIVVTAAKRYGVKAWGFDIDPVRVEEARANVAAAGVGRLVTIEEKDIFTLDLSPANVVTLYLLPHLNVRLIPQLQKLRPGSRIVSHDFDMEGVEPIRHLTMKLDSEHEIYLWRTPLQVKKPARDDALLPEPG